MKKNAKIILGIVLVAVVLCIVFFAVNSAKNEAERKERQEKIAKEEQKIAEDIVLPIAKECGIDDLKFESIEADGYYAECSFSSESYASLSNEKKVELLVAVAEETRLNLNYFPLGTNCYGLYFDFQVISDNHTYRDFTADGETWLMEDGKEIFRMETEYAKSFEKGSGSSGSKCSNCNGTGRVKYYYGGSSLEAALDGYNDYEYGQCGSCHGTGKKR